MANITSYKEVESLASNDLFIISDTSQDNVTRSVKLTDLSAYINGEGSGSPGSGTVTSITGTGTVSGITLSGTVTSSGSLTLGGSLSLTSQEIINFLGYTPSSFDGDYNSLTNKPADSAILSISGTPTLAVGITAEEIRTLIGVGDGTGTDIGFIASTGNGTITSSDGADATVPLAVAQGNSGLMSGIDKNKLDNFGVPDDYVKNTSDTFAGSEKIRRIITLTQTEYDNTPGRLGDALYIIVD